MKKYEPNITSKNTGQSVNTDSNALKHTIPNSVLNDVMSGSKRATSEMMGHRTNLAPSIMAKMSKAFGMDFSNLSIYTSDYMAQTKAKGMAQGNKVVLSSDVNLNSLSGQAILGHELSHIHAQSMGEGLGHSGLYDNAALEQKADAEGMMAARGMNIFGESSSMSESTGMASFDSLTPIGSGMGATAGAPMQAFLFGNKNKNKDPDEESKRKLGDDFYANDQALEGRNEEEDVELYKENLDIISFDDFIDTIPWMSGKDDELIPEDKKSSAFTFYTDSLLKNRNKKHIESEIYNNFEKYSQGQKLPSIRFNKIAKDRKNKADFGKPLYIKGIQPTRILTLMNTEMVDDYSVDEIKEMFGDLLSYDKQEDGKYKKGNVDDARVFKGIDTYRRMFYGQLKRMEREFGTTLTQMHPQDLINRFGAKKLYSNIQIMQDIVQLFPNGKNTDEAREYVKENSKDVKMDADMERLYNYYNGAFTMLNVYLLGMESPDTARNGFFAAKGYKALALNNEHNINGPKMNPEQLEKYRKYIDERIAHNKINPWLEDMDL